MLVRACSAFLFWEPTCSDWHRHTIRGQRMYHAIWRPGSGSLLGHLTATCILSLRTNQPNSMTFAWNVWNTILMTGSLEERRLMMSSSILERLFSVVDNFLRMFIQQCGIQLCAESMRRAARWVGRMSRYHCNMY